MKPCRRTLYLGLCTVASLAGCAQTGPVPASKAIRVEPVYRVQQPVGTAAAHYAVGRIALGEGRYEAAIGRFRQALQLDPDFVDAHNGLGVAYGQTGRFDLAVEAFRAALASGQAAAHVLNNLGFAYLKAGRFDEAQAALQRSLDLDPLNAQTNENVRVLEEARPFAAPSRSAARDIVGAPEHRAFELVSSSASESILVPLGAHVYELRTRAPVARAPGPMPMAASVQTSRPSMDLGGGSAPAGAAGAGAPPGAASPVIVERVAARRIDSRRQFDAGSLASLAGFEVSNGVGLNGLAARTAERLAALGAPAARLSNVPGYGIDHTVIEYRDGHAAGAWALQQHLPVKARLVRSNELRSATSVRLVIGRDLVEARMPMIVELAPRLVPAAVNAGWRHS